MTENIDCSDGSFYERDGRIYVQATINGRTIKKSTGKKVNSINKAWTKRQNPSDVLLNILGVEKEKKSKDISIEDYSVKIINATSASRGIETQKDFLEDNLLYVTEKINQKYNLDIHPMPHSGSIKTIAGAFAMIRAHISRSSFEWVANVTGMDETIRSADVMITATDEVSTESMHDEILFHLSKIAGYSKMPTFVLCNNFIDDFEDYEQLFTGIFSTQMSNYAQKNKDEQLIFEHYESIANQLARTLGAFHNVNH